MQRAEKLCLHKKPTDIIFHLASYTIYRFVSFSFQIFRLYPEIQWDILPVY